MGDEKVILAGPLGEAPSRKWVAGGFPTSMYTGSSKLGDVSVKPELYNFGAPSPMPNLSNLRIPVELDFNRAKELFLMPAGGQRSVSSTTSIEEEE